MFGVYNSDQRTPALYIGDDHDWQDPNGQCTNLPTRLASERPLMESEPAELRRRLAILHSIRRHRGRAGPLVESVTRYGRASRAPSTLRGYRSDWVDFQRSCMSHWLDSLLAAPGTVAAYISARADGKELKAGSVQRRVSAIAAL
jgi:hypothetical protein